MADLYQNDHDVIVNKIDAAIPFTKFDSAVHFKVDAQASIKFGRPMYRVLQAFRFYIGNPEDQRWVYVPEGFLTDLATVPSMLEWLIPHDGPYAKAAIVHDLLCEQATIFHKGEPIYVSFDRAHKIFDDAMHVLGVHRMVRYLLVGAVRFHFWRNGYEVPKELVGKTNDTLEWQNKKA